MYLKPPNGVEHEVVFISDIKNPPVSEELRLKRLLSQGWLVVHCEATNIGCVLVLQKDKI